jgi:hypothetical protein
MLVSSSSSSSPNNSDEVERFLKERRRKEELSNRFFEIYGVSYNSDPEKLARAEWILRKKHVLEWIDHAGITYLSRLHRELQDHFRDTKDEKYDIPRSTLNDYLSAVIEDGLLDELQWFPNSKKLKYTRYIISPSCDFTKIERTINTQNKKDEHYANQSKKTSSIKREQLINTIKSLELTKNNLDEHSNNCHQCRTLIRNNASNRCPIYSRLSRANNDIQEKIDKINNKLDT